MFKMCTKTVMIQFIAFFDIIPSTHALLFSMLGIFSTQLYGTTVVCDSKGSQHESESLKANFKESGHKHILYVQVTVHRDKLRIK